MNKKNIFSNRTLLITGGTGSFGTATLNKFLNTDIKKIIIFSRDEKKQNDMRKYYTSSKLEFVIGDIRDYNSILNATRNVDFVFHAAALKQVPSCEFYPLEAVKTNILGTENLIEASINNKVNKVICLSTDKAVYPANAMGMSKGLMEKVMVGRSRNLKDNKTIITGTRYGNVLASRGSVIPLFFEQVKNNNPITITDPKMTRFIMTLEEAVELVLFAFENGNNGDIFVQKSPAATVENLAKSILKYLKKENHPIKIIGTRHGEKLYETLLTREELTFSEDLGKFYKIKPDQRNLNYNKYYEDGETDISDLDDYNSQNTKLLSVDEIVTILNELKIEEIPDNG